MSNQSREIDLRSMRLEALEKLSDFQHGPATVSGDQSGDSLPDKVRRQKRRRLRHIAFNVCVNVDEAGRER